MGGQLARQTFNPPDGARVISVDRYPPAAERKTHTELPEQVRQLGDVGRNPTCLIRVSRFGRGLSPGPQCIFATQLMLLAVDYRRGD